MDYITPVWALYLIEAHHIALQIIQNNAQKIVRDCTTTPTVQATYNIKLKSLRLRITLTEEAQTFAAAFTNTLH